MKLSQQSWHFSVTIWWQGDHIESALSPGHQLPVIWASTPSLGVEQILDFRQNLRKFLFFLGSSHPGTIFWSSGHMTSKNGKVWQWMSWTICWVEVYRISLIHRFSKHTNSAHANCQSLGQGKIVTGLNLFSVFQKKVITKCICCEYLLLDPNNIARLVPYISWLGTLARDWWLCVQDLQQTKCKKAQMTPISLTV